MAAAATAWLGCSPAAEDSAFRPIADNRLLMQAVVDPSAFGIWNAVRTVVTEQGTQEIRPQTDEEWTAVRNHAIALAESGNLLLMPPRAKDSPEWTKVAGKLVEAASAAIKAAEAKDADLLFEVGGNIYTVCTNCHQRYPPSVAATAPQP